MRMDSRRRLRQHGGAAVEVAIVFALIVVASIGAMAAMGGNMSGLFSRGSNALTSTMDTIDLLNPPDLGACKAANPPVGTVCGDGTVFVGFTQDPGCSHCKILAARCDVGAAWTGGACTGAAQWKPWNDGGVIGVDTPAENPSSNSYWKGRGDTAIEVSADAGPGDGKQPHEAAIACDSLIAHGRGDWHLPAIGELNLVYQARSAVGGFVPVPSGYSIYYWSSTEANAAQAKARAFPAGVNSLSKHLAVASGGYALGPYVRCVRLEE